MNKISSELKEEYMYDQIEHLFRSMEVEMMIYENLLSFKLKMTNDQI